MPGSEAADLPLAGFEHFAGSVVLVEFLARGETGDPLIEAWSDQGTIPGLKFVRVGPAAATAEPTGIERLADPDGLMARLYGVRGRRWYVLLDRCGRRRYGGAELPAVLMADWAQALADDPAGPNDPAAMLVPRSDGSVLLRATLLKTPEGERARIEKGKAGAIVMFVDTTCPYCEQAVSELPLLCEAFDTLDLSVTLVNIGESAERVVEHYLDGGRWKRDKYRLLYDPGLLSRYTWGVDTIPRVFVLDADGGIRYAGAALWMDVVRAASEITADRAQPISTPVRGTGYG